MQAMRRCSVNGHEAFQEANEAYIRNLQAAVKQRRNEMKAIWGEVDEGWTALRKRMVEVGVRLPDPTEDSMLRLNIGEELVELWRSSLNSSARVRESRLGALFSVEWDKPIPKASDGRVVLDESPASFKYLTNLLLTKEGSHTGKSSNSGTNLSSFEGMDSCHTTYTAYLADFLRLNFLRSEGGMTVRGGSRVLSGRGQTKMLRQLKDWLSNSTQLNLLYRASRDGFSPTSFHEKCDNAQSSITLIKVRRPSDTVSSIVGGYSSASWAPSANSPRKFKTSPGAFIFLLQDGPGGASPLKWHEMEDIKPTQHSAADGFRAPTGKSGAYQKPTLSTGSSGGNPFVRTARSPPTVSYNPSTRSWECSSLAPTAQSPPKESNLSTGSSGGSSLAPTAQSPPKESTSESPPKESTSVLCSSTHGPQFGDGGLRIKLMDPPTDSTLRVGSANYILADRSKAGKAMLALNGARIVDIEVFSPHGPSNRTGVSTSRPDCSKSGPRSIKRDIDCFGTAIAECMARERHMLNIAEAELAGAETELEAALEAFEAIYGPFVASGTEDPVVELNVREVIFTTLVSTLQACPDSALATRFHKERCPPSEKDVDSQGRYLLDCDPLCFSRILDVLRMRKRHAWTSRASWVAQDGMDDDYLGFVAVPESHREAFVALVNMYFPGCEGFINELVEYETPAC